MTEPSDLPEHVSPDAETPGLDPATLDPAGFDPAALLGGGGLDLGALLGAAQQMGAQMEEAQERIGATEVEGTSGGELVRVTALGSGAFTGVHIDPSVIDPADPSMLEDLVLAALLDLGQQIAELQAEASPMGGLDLGGLFG